MSRVFEFRWSKPALEINFRLPYARVLAEEEQQREADAVDGGDDWSGLVRRLETTLPEGRKELSIIWP